VITLLALALLAGLIFYVYNAGDQIDRRMELQNAADSAVAAGAGWIARSMNVIAMNNVTQARLMALALTLDSLPLAAEMTVSEHTGQDSIREVLARQLSRGVPATRGGFLSNGLTHIYKQMEPHAESIRVVDESFDQRDERFYEDAYVVDADTRWPEGNLWQAATTLGELSRTILDSAGTLAQAHAADFGHQNGAAAAVLVPVAPELPAREGDFEDFLPLFSDHLRIVNSPSHGLYSQDVVRSDLAGALERSSDLLRDIIYFGRRRWDIPDFYVQGGAIPDYDWPHRLGPFAGVYRWRDGVHTQNDQWGVSGWEYDRIGYTTYGPLEHALRRVLSGFGQMGAWRNQDTVAWTLRFPHHVRKIAKLKLAYMMGLDSPRELQYSDKWIVGFDAARKFAEDSPDDVAGIRYYRVTVDSRLPWTDPRWMEGDSTDPQARTWFSWQLHPPADRTIEEQPLSRWSFDPWDSRGRRYRWWQPSGDKVRDHVWISRRQMRVRSYQHFNWLERPIYDEQGNVTGYDEYDLYRVSWYVWGGLEVRDPVTVSDPLNGADPIDLPAPILLETEDEQCEWLDLEDTQAVRVRPFEFLCMAMRSDAARIWPQRFESQSPANSAVAVAQAKVFNDQSWDLWTQNWQSQLSPVTDWQSWAELLADTAGGAEVLPPSISQEELDAAVRYAEALSGELADEFLVH